MGDSEDVGSKSRKSGPKEGMEFPKWGMFVILAAAVLTFCVSTFVLLFVVLTFFNVKL